MRPLKVSNGDAGFPSSASPAPDGRVARGRTAPRPPKYRTIVADPPWHYEPFPTNHQTRPAQLACRTDGPASSLTPHPYPSMSLDEIRDLPVGDVADRNAHLYLWTTRRYLPDAFSVLSAWGFRYSATLVWAKPTMGIGLGGTFASNVEFILFGRRGSLPALRRVDTSWWGWQRVAQTHSRKPDAFLDTVEGVSPGPYLELFARRQRLGWDTWGDQALEHVDLGGRSEDTDTPETLSGSQSG